MAEDDVLTAARARAEEVGVVPIGSGGGAALRFLASVLDARAVVEVGTGTGVSGLWLLRGMRSDGVLTTVDIEAEHQRLARQTFSDAVSVRITWEDFSESVEQTWGRPVADSPSSDPLSCFWSSCPRQQRPEG